MVIEADVAHFFLFGEGDLTIDLLLVVECNIRFLVN